MVNEELNGVDTDTEDTKLVNEELFEMEQAKDLPFDYVKVIPKKALFLGYITEEHPNPTPAALPDWIYLRRRKGTSLRFGYIYQPLDNPPRRQGLRKGPIRVLDLFAGAGGMHQGFKRVPGFQTAKVVEMNELSVKTFQSNNPGVSVYAGDVRKFLQEARDPQIRKKLGVIDHIHASPPCQGFSCANIWGGKNDEANNNLSLVWIDAIRQFRPKTASFENVGGMWRNKHFHYLRFIMKELLALGYQVCWDAPPPCIC
jgi:C-5 cytosine-specific DNA methylase